MWFHNIQLESARIFPMHARGMSYCGAHRITEQRDTLGRSTGCVYAKNDILHKAK